MQSTPDVHDAARRAWHRLLLATADLQAVVGNSVLVGGTAAALAAGHRYSQDSDHVLPDLENRFTEITALLDAVPGWHTARIRERKQSFFEDGRFACPRMQKYFASRASWCSVATQSATMWTVAHFCSGWATRIWRLP